MNSFEERECSRDTAGRSLTLDEGEIVVLLAANDTLQDTDPLDLPKALHDI
jgi:hypothetical protein